MITIVDHDQAKNSDAITMRSENTELRNELQRQVDEFLASGRSVTTIPYGVVARNDTEKLSEDENRARMKGISNGI